MEKKKNIVIIILSFIIVVLSSFILYDKFLFNDDSNDDVIKDNNDIKENDTIRDNNNDNSDKTNNIITGNRINEVEIKNVEVKELYNYTQASLNSFYVCLGYFYQNPFKNHSLEDKISLVLINYASNYQKEIDDEFLQKINKDQREFVDINSDHYIDANIVKKGMKLIFNIDVTEFKDGPNNYNWNYISEVDAFVDVFGGGGYEAFEFQKIIDYIESDNEISLTVVKAEITPLDEVYRYVNDKNTLVYENISIDDFMFTDENIDKFPQLKYVFKKNETGNYYVSDIINLNYEEDFAKCD